MCGIIGAFERKDAFRIVQTGLGIIAERGKDGCGYYDGKAQYAKKATELPSSVSSSVLGHTLHAVVDFVPQPIEENGAALVVNGEIYNWKELAREYHLTARNDSELLLKLLNTLGIEKTLDCIHGVYAFAYWKGNTVYLARDILGVKPLWYSIDENMLLFCSEKKGIEKKTGHVEELNPRKILIYDVKKKRCTYSERHFFTIAQETEENILSNLKNILKVAIQIRIPEKKFGLLFSGGIDSLVLAKILKNLGHEYTCYTAATSEDAPDLIAAKDTAKKLGLELKYKIVTREETETYLRKIVPLIEDNNVIKVGVALPLYIASELARDDGNKVIFSGAGADELFGGYHRYKTTNDLKKLNNDCYSDLLKIYERNTYRDDVITMNNNLELRVPYLDKNVVAYALSIPSSWKINDDIEKYVLRKIAVDIGIPEEFAFRKKKAAQYGSGFDKMIEKLAGKQTKSAYLKQFFHKGNVKLGALISSGKDSWFAAYTMHKQNYTLACIITMKSKNPSSYMFHTPNVEMVELQAQAAQIPLVMRETTGEKEHELKDLEEAMRLAKEKYHIEGIVSGALYSNYQRERIEKIADKVGLKIFAPLWHIDQEYEMRELLRQGFTIVLSSIAADGFDASWLGKVLTEEDIDKLLVLHKKYGINIAFEGGEAESLVLDCPLFQKRIFLKEKKIIKENKHTAQLLVKKAMLEEK